MNHLFKIFLLMFLCWAVSGCKVGAFYVGTADLEGYEGDVSKIFSSPGFKSSLEKFGYSVNESKSKILEVKSSLNDEYEVKLIIQNDKTTIQAIGVDFLPQECGYNRDCPISEKSRRRMLDLIRYIGEAISCNIGKTTVSDIKNMDSPSKQMEKWREDPFYIVK